MRSAVFLGLLLLLGPVTLAPTTAAGPCSSPTDIWDIGECLTCLPAHGTGCISNALEEVLPP